MGEIEEDGSEVVGREGGKDLRGEGRGETLRGTTMEGETPTERGRMEGKKAGMECGKCLEKRIG